MTTQRVAIIGVFLALIVLAALYFAMPKAAQPVTVSNSDTPIIAVFTCDAGKSITAIFTNSVQLKLSDGREVTLPHAISASGARYANSDESFVFWNKGNGAFIQEGGATTYANCTTPTH